MSYSWTNNKCVRYYDHKEGEEHPCYWCGTPIPIKVGMSCCPNCGGAFCPECKKCWCNILVGEAEALRKLRDKYCCNLIHFTNGVQPGDPEENLIKQFVPCFQQALDYCRERRGVI